MTYKDLVDNNPWVEVADMYESDDNESLFSSRKQYVCKDDSDVVRMYNEKCEKDDAKSDKIITNIPAEPWWGNPLKARLIILSLNPGFVPEVNEKLAKLMQSNDILRKQLMEFKANTLRLREESFLPQEDDTQPISCRDAVNMLGDWYWHRMLKQLKSDVGIGDDEFYKQVALVESCGYSSITAKRKLPKNEEVNSNSTHVFLKKMMEYIVTERKKDVKLLVMRSVQLWNEILDFEKHKDIILYRKTGSRSQYITKNNLQDGHYDILKHFMQHGK